MIILHLYLFRFDILWINIQVRRIYPLDVSLIALAIVVVISTTLACRDSGIKRTELWHFTRFRVDFRLVIGPYRYTKTPSTWLINGSQYSLPDSGIEYWFASQSCISIEIQDCVIYSNRIGRNAIIEIIARGVAECKLFWLLHEAKPIVMTGIIAFLLIRFRYYRMTKCDYETYCMSYFYCTVQLWKLLHFQKFWNLSFFNKLAD